MCDPGFQIEYQRRIAAYQYCHCPAASSRASRSFGVDGDIGRDHERKTAIPRLAIYPCTRIKDGCCASLACIHSCNALDVSIAFE